MEVVDREGHAIARYFAANGLVAAVLKYRLPTSDTFEKGIPRSQEDAMEAVRHLRRRANDWQINERRIGIMGFSAGGHLAGSTTMLAKVNDGSRPDFAVLMYAVTLMHGEHMHVGSRDRLIGPSPSAARVAEFSLEKRVRADLPPSLSAMLPMIKWSHSQRRASRGGTSPSQSTYRTTDRKLRRPWFRLRSRSRICEMERAVFYMVRYASLITRISIQALLSLSDMFANSENVELIAFSSTLPRFNLIRRYTLNSLLVKNLTRFAMDRMVVCTA